MASSNLAWGIEVGAGAIKALKLQRDGDDLRVLDFVVLPHKRVLSTPDLDEGDAIRVGLGALMGQYRDEFKGAQVAVSVPGHASFARFAKLPPVAPKDVPKMVKYEADQQIPFPMEDVEWDYQTFRSEDSPDVEIGIFAITKQRIQEILAQYGNSGLTPGLITLGPLAVYNAISYDLGFTEETPGTILLDIGTTSTDLIIAEAGRVWIRTFPIGGHNFTEAIAEAFKLQYGKADRLKREADSSKYRKHIFQAIKPVLADLVGDVQRSIQYYEDTHPNAKLQRLVGMGSTFRLPGLRKLLTAQIKLDVYRLERFKRLQVDGAAAADFEAVTLNMATCYGLALQAMGLHTIGANLIPVPVVRREVWKRKTPWFIAAAALGLIAGGVTFVKPAMEASEVSKAKVDPNLTRPIASAKTLGGRLKNEWSEVERETPEPGLVAWNMASLHEDRSVYDSILEKVDVMLAYADERYNATTGQDGRAFRVKQLNTGYIKPGDPLKMPAESRFSGGGGMRPTAQQTTTADTGGGVSSGGRLGRRMETDASPFGGGGRDSRSGGRSSRGGGGQQDEPVAGEFGAIGLTLTLESDHPDDITFLNDTILTWLRDNIEPKDAPFTIYDPPNADDIAFAPIQRRESTGESRDIGVGTGRTPTTTRGSGGFGARDGAGGSEQNVSRQLGSLPPLPGDLVREPETGEAYSYQIQLMLQLKDPNASEEAQGEAVEEDQA